MHVPGPIKKVLKMLFPFEIRDEWAVRSWSQEGEDLILRRIFGRKKNGFYVDVGAHHPKRFSNTFFFYKQGWRGINIDAMPGSMRAFQKVRSRDINLEIGIGDQEERLEFFMFNEPALNSFSRNLSSERNDNQSNYRIESVIQIDVLPLRKVLAKYMPAHQTIDFLSVDVEGKDEQVLKSNDWDSFRPSYVLVEILGSSLHEIQESEIGKFMAQIGYVLFAKCFHTVFFRDSSTF